MGTFMGLYEIVEFQWGFADAQQQQPCSSNNSRNEVTTATIAAGR
jgi:hypothetical protein